MSIDEIAEDVHGYFGLTYANYLVLHRSILQSMPEEWQCRFVALLKELDEAVIGLPMPFRYDVRVRGSDGRYISDPIPPYDRGRTRVPLADPYG